MCSLWRKCNHKQKFMAIGLVRNSESFDLWWAKGRMSTSVELESLH